MPILLSRLNRQAADNARQRSFGAQTGAYRQTALIHDMGERIQRRYSAISSPGSLASTIAQRFVASEQAAPGIDLLLPRPARAPAVARWAARWPDTPSASAGTALDAETPEATPGPEPLLHDLAGQDWGRSTPLAGGPARADDAAASPSRLGLPPIRRAARAEPAPVARQPSSDSAPPPAGAAPQEPPEASDVQAAAADHTPPAAPPENANTAELLADADQPANTTPNLDRVFEQVPGAPPVIAATPSAPGSAASSMERRADLPPAMPSLPAIDLTLLRLAGLRPTALMRQLAPDPLARLGFAPDRATLPSATPARSTAPAVARASGPLRSPAAGRASAQLPRAGAPEQPPAEAALLDAAPLPTPDSPTARTFPAGVSADVSTAASLPAPSEPASAGPPAAPSQAPELPIALGGALARRVAVDLPVEQPAPGQAGGRGQLVPLASPPRLLPLHFSELVLQRVSGGAGSMAQASAPVTRPAHASSTTTLPIQPAGSRPAAGQAAAIARMTTPVAPPRSAPAGWPALSAAAGELPIAAPDLPMVIARFTEPLVLLAGTGLGQDTGAAKNVGWQPADPPAIAREPDLAERVGAPIAPWSALGQPLVSRAGASWGARAWPPTLPATTLPAARMPHQITRLTDTGERPHADQPSSPTALGPDALPLATPAALVLQRASDQFQREDQPGSAESAAAPHPAAPGQPGGSQAQEDPRQIERLANQVYEHLRRRLLIDYERRGARL
jgi:hypothetical protein